MNSQPRFSCTFRGICLFVCFTFLITFAIPPTPGDAQMITQAFMNLPAPGTMIGPSMEFTPTLVRGLTIYPENPFQFDFIIDTEDSGLKGKAFNAEAIKLIKYFLASLTVPDEEVWVNLSPAEKNRIVGKGLGQTQMGIDMLAQDYLLKQLTASLMYPEKELGKKFWKRVYQKVRAQYGNVNIPTDAFHKVWIVPDRAKVYENGNSVFVLERHLKVMLEEDYFAAQNNLSQVTSHKSQESKISSEKFSTEAVPGKTTIEQAIREIILPEIEHEINHGKHFAQLRQIYNSMILATWYKRALKDSLLAQLYANQNKIKGVDTRDGAAPEKIYAQYIEAFQRGVYNYIKEDIDPDTKKVIPRQYFSGGLVNVRDLEVVGGAVNRLSSSDSSMMTSGESRRGDVQRVTWRANQTQAQAERPNDNAMLTEVNSGVIADEFLEHMKAGMKGEHKTLAMLNSYLKNATGNEEGEYLAVDWGGTNLRVMLVKLAPGKNPEIKQLKKYKFTKAQKKDVQSTFKFVAEQIRELQLEQGRTYKLGLLFSFPFELLSVNSGRLADDVGKGKGWNLPQIAGQDPVKLLQDALVDTGVNALVAVALNDTVGIQLVGQGASVGLIFGTGFNMAFRLSSGELVNIEAGNFNAEALGLDQIDLQILNELEPKGAHALEKMVSGDFIREQVRFRLLEQLSSKAGLLKKLTEPASFGSDLISEVEGLRSADDQVSRVQQLINERFALSGDNVLSAQDAQIICELCRQVSMRAGKLVAAVLIATLRFMDPNLNEEHVIAVDGTVYEKHPLMAKYVNEGLEELIGEKARQISFKRVEDGSGLGAAIAAAVVDNAQRRTFRETIGVDIAGTSAQASDREIRSLVTRLAAPYLSQLSSSNWQARRDAVRDVGALKYKGAMQEVAQLLLDSDTRVIQAAEATLAQLDYSDEDWIMSYFQVLETAPKNSAAYKNADKKITKLNAPEKVLLEFLQDRPAGSSGNLTQRVDDIVILGNYDLNTFRKALRLFRDAETKPRIVITGGRGRFIDKMIETARDYGVDLTAFDLQTVSEAELIYAVILKMIEQEPEFSRLSKIAAEPVNPINIDLEPNNNPDMLLRTPKENSVFVLEPNSTNTPQNLFRYREILEKTNALKAEGKYKVVYVQTPHQQFRSHATFEKIFEGTGVLGLSRTVSYNLESHERLEMLENVLSEPVRLIAYSRYGNESIWDLEIPDSLWGTAYELFAGLDAQDQSYLAQRLLPIIQGVGKDFEQEILPQLPETQGKFIRAISEKAHDSAMLSSVKNGIGAAFSLQMEALEYAETDEVGADSAILGNHVKRDSFYDSHRNLFVELIRNPYYDVDPQVDIFGEYDPSEEPLFKAVKQELRRLIQVNNIQPDKWVDVHSFSVAQNAEDIYQRLYNKPAPVYLKLAALLHDIDRAVPDWEIHKEDYQAVLDQDLFYDVYKRAHSLQSARIAEDVLIKAGAKPELVTKVVRVIMNHEFGGHPDTNIVKDADAMSFFQDNVDTYAKRGKDKTKNHMAMSFFLASPLGQKLIDDVMKSRAQAQDISEDILQWYQEMRTDEELQKKYSQSEGRAIPAFQLVFRNDAKTDQIFAISLDIDAGIDLREISSAVSALISNYTSGYSLSDFDYVRTSEKLAEAANAQNYLWRRISGQDDQAMVGDQAPITDIHDIHKDMIVFDMDEANQRPGQVVSVDRAGKRWEIVTGEPISNPGFLKLIESAKKGAPGGIDLNPNQLDLQIKRDGNGIPLPLPQQPPEIIQIEGLTPVIINVTPANIPMMLGLKEEEAEELAKL